MLANFLVSGAVATLAVSSLTVVTLERLASSVTSHMILDVANFIELFFALYAL